MQLIASCMWVYWLLGFAKSSCSSQKLPFPLLDIQVSDPYNQGISLSLMGEKAHLQDQPKRSQGMDGTDLLSSPRIG